jgi:hypothetical protein
LESFLSIDEVQNVKQETVSWIYRGPGKIDFYFFHDFFSSLLISQIQRTRSNIVPYCHCEHLKGAWQSLCKLRDCFAPLAMTTFTPGLGICRLSPELYSVNDDRIIKGVVRLSLFSKTGKKKDLCIVKEYLRWKHQPVRVWILVSPA